MIEQKILQELRNNSGLKTESERIAYLTYANLAVKGDSPFDTLKRVYVSGGYDSRMRYFLAHYFNLEQNPILSQMLNDNILLQEIYKSKSEIKGRLDAKEREFYQNFGKLIGRDTAYIDNIPMTSSNNQIPFTWLVGSIGAIFVGAGLLFPETIEYTIGASLMIGEDRSILGGGASILTGLGGCLVSARALIENKYLRPKEEREIHLRSIGEFQDLFDKYNPLKNYT